MLSVRPIQAFFDGNRRLSLAVARLWSHDRYWDMQVRYCEAVAQSVRRYPGQFVADVGGGKSLRYAEYVATDEAHVVAVDISRDELHGNASVAETRVADIQRRLPFADGEVDLLTSSSVLEHLPNVERFLDEAARVLKVDGMMVHIFPCRYATFALLNRALPHRFKLWVLGRIYPHREGKVFPVYYDRCYYSAITRECQKRGFVVESTFFGYYGSSDYYAVFFPLFLVSLAWEMATLFFRARNLATSLVIVARRLPTSA